MATINKRKLVSGRVVWELTHGTGRDRRRFIAGDTREQAQRVLEQFNRQLALHGTAPQDDSVDAVVGRYLTFLKTNRRHGTFRRYERVIKTFHACFLVQFHPGVQRLRQLTPAHLEEYKVKRLEGGIQEVADDTAVAREQSLRHDLANRPRAASPKANARFGWLGRKRLKRSIAARTVNYELQVLGTFLSWAIGQNHLFVNPARAVPRYRVSKRTLPKFLTREQLTRLFAACDEHERRLFMTIVLTGMRKGEAEHLTWTDINFEMNLIFIQEKPAWGWKPKTDERIIPISPTLKDILLPLYTTRRNDGLVFPNKDGNIDTHMLAKLQKICRRAGLPRATVHALRHSFGAHLRMAGVNLADIADLMGHKDLATTQIYAKAHQEHLRAAVAKLKPIDVEPTTPRLETQANDQTRLLVDPPPSRRLLDR